MVLEFLFFLLVLFPLDLRLWMQSEAASTRKVSRQGPMKFHNYAPASAIFEIQKTVTPSCRCCFSAPVSVILPWGCGDPWSNHQRRRTRSRRAAVSAMAVWANPCMNSDHRQCGWFWLPTLVGHPTAKIGSKSVPVGIAFLKAKSPILPLLPRKSARSCLPYFNFFGTRS